MDYLKYWWKKLNGEIKISGAKKLIGSVIIFDKITVTRTENIIMAASLEQI